MDQKRLMLAIAMSIAILLGFQLLMPKKPVPVVASLPVAADASSTTAKVEAAADSGTPKAAAAVTPVDGSADERDAPRVAFSGPRVQGSINLRGAKFDDLVLRDYRDTIEKDSPNVRVLEPRSEKQPYYVQFGWTPAVGTDVKLPDSDTIWTASGNLSATSKVQLRWDNGAGLEFLVNVGLDENFMFTVEQKVINHTQAAVSLYPYSRIRRDYTPQTSGYYILHEGMIGILNGTEKDVKYTDAKSEAEKHEGVAFTSTGAGGWAGFTDKYWLTALIPDQAVPQIGTYRYINNKGDRYQVDYLAKDAIAVPAAGEAAFTTRLFAGAKEVKLLKSYTDSLGIPKFDDAVDWGLYFFITKPFFLAIDFLYGFLGNFGLAIMAFTLILKLLFFPLANKSYRSMSKMKLLAPKMAALKEQFKDEPQKLQSAMMQMYKTEKVNPASGCLPMIVQIPVFFSLYKVIFITIEMRQAPFFGWIHDLSMVDPSNVFNLFGLIPYDPSVLTPYLHLGGWPLLMGVTMYFQQRLNPPPPDPTQAKLFQFMPIMFTFMLASFPAGLVIYWSWNNFLTIVQQSFIMRQTRLTNPSAARVPQVKS